MPIISISGIAAVTLYLLTLGLQSQSLKSGTGRQRTQTRVIIAGFLGLLAHAISAWSLISRGNVYHFGVSEISTLIFVSIVLVTLLSSTRRPTGNLILGVFPLAIFSIVLSLTVTSTYPARALDTGLAAHVVLSIVAYSLFTLAAVQSCLLAFQNYQLKHHHVAAVMRKFPPLQDMEKFLFELLWVAQILLSLAIVAGFVFISDFHAQGLAHKMFFSILAWLVFGALLWGRHQLGWRGQTAIRGTLSGFALLLIGFYGSKFVLEFLL